MHCHLPHIYIYMFINIIETDWVAAREYVKATKGYGMPELAELNFPEECVAPHVKHVAVQNKFSRLAGLAPPKKRRRSPNDDIRRLLSYFPNLKCINMPLETCFSLIVWDAEYMQRSFRYMVTNKNSYISDD